MTDFLNKKCIGIIIEAFLAFLINHVELQTMQSDANFGNFTLLDLS
jgi:hypothetical protein